MRMPRYAEAGAEVVDPLDLGALDVLVHVRPLDPATPARLRRGAITVGLGVAVDRARHGPRAARRRHHRLRARPPAAHLARAVDGRASRPRRSSPATAACSRPRCGCRASSALHDRGRHAPARRGARARRGCRRAPGDRHGEAARRARLGERRAGGIRRRGRARWAARSSTSTSDRRSGAAATRRSSPKTARAAAGAARAARRRIRHRHHDRGGPRPPGPAPRDRRDGRRDEARLGARRPRRRVRRQRRGLGRRAETSRCDRRRRAAR